MKMHELLMAVALLLTAILIAGHMDYDDQVHDDEMYCEMVDAGVWPAYRGEGVCK